MNDLPQYPTLGAFSNAALDFWRPQGDVASAVNVAYATDGIREKMAVAALLYEALEAWLLDQDNKILGDLLDAARDEFAEVFDV